MTKLNYCLKHQISSYLGARTFHQHNLISERINKSLVPGPMRGFWCHLTVWTTAWWRWVWLLEGATEDQEVGWCPPWAGSATTRRPSRSRTSVSRHPWTATTWSRWTPTRRQATTTTAAPPPCPGWACKVAGIPMSGVEQGRWKATPTLGGWPSPARGRTPLNSCTSSLEEEECRDCGPGVRTR